MKAQATQDKLEIQTPPHLWSMDASIDLGFSYFLY